MPTYVDQYSQRLSKLLGSAGQEAIHSLSPELMAAIVLENDRPEQLLLGGTRLWMGRVFVPLVAAQWSAALISGGPPAAKTITTIKKIVPLTGAAPITIGFVAGSSGFTTITPMFPRDSRATGRTQTNWTLRNQAAQQFSAGSPFVIPAAGMDVDIVISRTQPGQGAFVMEAQVIATLLDVLVFGYERVADDHELDATVV